MKQLNNIISLLLFVCATVAVTAADGDLKREPSKLIVTSKKNRQLSGSKSGKKFFTKGSKRSRRKRKQGGVSSPRTASRSKQSTASADSSTATTNRDGFDDNRIEKLSSSDGVSDGANLLTNDVTLITNTLDFVATGVSGQGQQSSSSGTSSSKSSSTSTNDVTLITNTLDFVAIEVSGQGQQSSSSGTSSSKSSSTSSSTSSGTSSSTSSSTNSDINEEIETIFVETEDKFFETEDSGDHSGLRKQNLIVGATALLAILLAIAGVFIQRKKAAEAEAGANILDSVEITPATAVEKTNKPSSNDTAAPVEDTDYSCDIFAFNNCFV